MTDHGKSNATKRYQNSDYPSGSFEAAISVDQGSTGLRLVREPSSDASRPDDLEEMVPAFMHRDFFRTEEDGVDAVPTAATRAPLATPSNYLEPPNTEEFEPEPAPAPVARTATPAPASTPSAAPPRSAPTALKTPPVANRPVPPPLEISTAAGSPEPLSPLRSADIPEPPVAPRPSESPSSRSQAPPPAAPAPAAAAPQSSGASAYSLPLLAALAMVLGVFVWRESTRPVVVPQQALPVPHTVTVADPSGEPSAAAPGFQPKYLSVGPAVPPDLAPSGSPSPTESGEMAENAADDPGALFPGAEPATSAEPDADADERSEMLSRMAASSSTSEPEAPVRVAKPNSSNNPGALFPSDAVPEPAAAKPAVKPKAPPAPKVSAAKPPEKVVNRPSAADLFPIDEEVPVRRPATAVVAQPAEQPPVPALSNEPIAPSRPVGDPYQIDEPNL